VVEAEAAPETFDGVEEHTQEWLDGFVARVVTFTEHLVGHDFFDYQRQISARIVESLVLNDGERITILQARQSGKTEVIANTLAACMILLPRLAKAFPDTLGKFKNGVMVGAFAPVQDMSETIYGRIVDRLTSDRATELMLDPDIDDKVAAKGNVTKLKNCGSLVRRQTANPRAKIEGKSYHVVLLDEAQDADEFVVNKSIAPMLAFYNGTMVMTGTPGLFKGVFHKTIQQNKRRQTKRGSRQNHFEFNWKACARNNPNYGKFVRKEMLRLGEDSDEFQLAYNLRWLLDVGMFTTEAVLDELGDTSMEVVRGWSRTPVVVGIDPAKHQDSTVVTVCWVGWDRPDEFGLYDVRVLNWLELPTGMDWEEQYFRIVEFLQPYNVYKVGVDANGVGDAVAERLQRLMPRTEVVPLQSDQATQSVRWKHLMTLMERRMVGWPAHAKTRRLKTYKRFRQQMEDLEKVYKGPNMLAAAPDESDAHDDYPDSLAMAAVLTKEGWELPEVEVTNNPFTMRR
jgi:hypothetical protein